MGQRHKEPWEDQYDHLPDHYCKGRDCQKDTSNDDTVEERHDAYGMSTGYYCDECYKNNYPYRKDSYFDQSYAGERMEDDY